MWNSCADVRISDTEPVTPYPPPAPPAPPAPKPKPSGYTCKATENPSCKGLGGGGAAPTFKQCVWGGCEKCADGTSFNCASCCAACEKYHDGKKGVDYCVPPKASAKGPRPEAGLVA